MTLYKKQKSLKHKEYIKIFLNEYWQGCEAIRTLCTLGKLAQPLGKAVWHSLVKLKIHISYYTAFSLLDILQLVINYCFIINKISKVWDVHIVE